MPDLVEHPYEAVPVPRLPEIADVRVVPVRLGRNIGQDVLRSHNVRATWATDSQVSLNLT